MTLVAETVRASEYNDDLLYPYFGEQCRSLAREVSQCLSGSYFSSCNYRAVLQELQGVCCVNVTGMCSELQGVCCDNVTDMCSELKSLTYLALSVEFIS
jgi:hypothetical protein